MTLRVRDIGTTRRAIRAQVRVGTSPLPIARMSFRTAAGLSQFFIRAMSVSANPTSVSGYGGKTGPVTSNSTQASASNGTPPYSFAWSTDAGFGATQPNSAMTAFVGSPPQGDSIDGTATCTITDASGLSAQVSVYVSLARGF